MRGAGWRGSVMYRGRILEQNPDKSLQSFPPCYSKPPLSTALPWDLYFFKLTQPIAYFFKLKQPLRVSVKFLYTVKERWENVVENLSIWFKTSIHKSQIWELSRIWPEKTSTKLYVHAFGFWSQAATVEGLLPFERTVFLYTRLFLFPHGKTSSLFYYKSKWGRRRMW
jgi:hypothetical protein